MRARKCPDAHARQRIIQLNIANSDYASARSELSPVENEFELNDPDYEGPSLDDFLDNSDDEEWVPDKYQTTLTRSGWEQAVYDTLPFLRYERGYEWTTYAILVSRFAIPDKLPIQELWRYLWDSHRHKVCYYGGQRWVRAKPSRKAMAAMRAKGKKVDTDDEPEHLEKTDHGRHLSLHRLRSKERRRQCQGRQQVPLLGLLRSGAFCGTL